MDYSKFTDSQKNAIFAKRSDILVSASAGSGKTTVLIGRLINQLCREDDPLDITRTLIVSYTKKAAGQLKEKISEALMKELSLNPESRIIRKQIQRLERTTISTIHSFCFDLIKKNFSRLGLPAGVRVCESLEEDILMSKVMKETFEEMYSDPNFDEFTDMFPDTSDDAIEHELISFYKQIVYTLNGVETLKDLDKNLISDSEKDPAETKAFKMLYDGFYFDILDYSVVFNELLYESVKDKQRERYVRSAIESLEGFISSFGESERSYNEFYDKLCSFNNPSLTSIRNFNDDEFKQKAKKVKESFKDLIDKAKDTFKTVDYKNECLEEAKNIRTVYRTLSLFEEKLSSEKKRLGMIDFTDLERYALKLLTEKDGSPSELAKRISLNYDELFIDEYQDTNEIQDSIFKAISNANRFMVGDVKQSIYGFRGADPSIFTEYRRSFVDYSDDNDSERIGKKIFLSDNFRSDKTVIDFANMIVGKCFGHSCGNMSYIEEDYLVHKKKEDEGEYKPRIVLIEKENEYSEADYIISEISELIDNGEDPSDIAVLARDNNTLDIISKRMKESELPVKLSRNGTVFDSPDVIVMICLLNCIDNPERDIYLAGAVKSPVYGITLDELSVIRKEYPGLSLYKALCEYSNANDFEKGKVFINSLEKYRMYAENRSSDRIVKYILNTTSIKAASISAKFDKSALTTFYDIARKYEKNSFKGLHSFISYIKSAMELKPDDSVSLSNDSKEKCINVLTVHKAKGLEFKYVFYAGLTKKMNPVSGGGHFIYDKDIGFSVSISDSEKNDVKSSLFGKAIKRSSDNNRIDDNIRNLYVALTRPRMALIITVCAKNAEKNFFEDMNLSTCASNFVFARATNVSEWISYSISDRSLYKIEITDAITPKENESYDENETDETISEKAEEAYNFEDYETLVSRINFVYPYSGSESIPAKLSVSKLAPDVLDERTEELLVSEKSEFMEMPAFLCEKVKAKASDRGTATHLFMQFCDFENASSMGVESEIERLINEKYISSEIASLIYKDKVDNFFKSELFSEITKSKRVIREKRFNVRLPASDFTLIPELKEKLEFEKVLVQGVIDCLLLKDDMTYKLIDYKTDYFDKDDKNAEKMLQKRYESQLSYYKIAVEKMTGAKVSETVIYSFALNREITVRTLV